MTEDIEGALLTAATHHAERAAVAEAEVAHLRGVVRDLLGVILDHDCEAGGFTARELMLVNRIRTELGV